MRERKPKRKIKYRTYQDYENEVKRQLNEVEKSINHLRVKGKYGIGTTTTQAMLAQGLSKLDIRKYWKRELQIITGEYEEIRDRKFINNYITMLKNQGVNEELINDFKRATRLKKNRRYVIARVPDFAFWGYAKNQKQKQISEEELEENIADLENLLKNLREN